MFSAGGPPPQERCFLEIGDFHSLAFERPERRWEDRGAFLPLFPWAKRVTSLCFLNLSAETRFSLTRQIGLPLIRYLFVIFIYFTTTIQH